MICLHKWMQVLIMSRHSKLEHSIGATLYAARATSSPSIFENQEDAIDCSKNVRPRYLSRILA